MTGSVLAAVCVWVWDTLTGPLRRHNERAAREYEHSADQADAVGAHRSAEELRLLAARRRGKSR